MNSKDSKHITKTTADIDFFQSYDREALKQDSITDYIDGWQIDYLGFTHPEVANQPPILILGGAFQSFDSYRYCMPALLAVAPVILIDLPATGSNQQVHNTFLKQDTNSLSMVDLADLLAQWIDSVCIKKVSIMGMSLGSVSAANFASKFPEKMHRLILMGVMERTRKSWRMLIEESLVELDNQNMSDFGEAVVLYLVNHARLDKTSMSSMARKMFHNQMASFTYNQQLRYHINAHRLLTITDVPKPKCPTLVATGQYDSFTLPHESASFAMSCDNATYAMINNTDHLPQLQKRKETFGLFSTFLANKPIDNLKDVSVLNTEQIKQLDKRSDKRIDINKYFELTHKLGKRKDTVMVHDMSFFGLLFSVETIEQASFIFAENRHMTLNLEDADGKFAIELLLFEQQARKIRALFKHGSFETAERFKTYLANINAQEQTTYLSCV